jgi:hypothetical protein
MAETLQDLQLILNDLADSSARIGLRMNLDKTKVMFNEHVLPEPSSKLFKNMSTSGPRANVAVR